MLAAILLAATLPPTQTAQVDLSRNAPILGGASRCWDVTDTYLESLSPEENFGGASTLLGGPGHTILIKFGDLNRMLGRVRVVKASLHLTPLNPDEPKLRAISRVLVPWGEGPLKPISSLIKPVDPKAKLDVPNLASTWRVRRGGMNLGWQQAGAMGNGDAEKIGGTSAVHSGGEYVIEGLGSTVQAMLDHWYDNHGFELNFDNGVEFFSSQAQSSRPRLVIETEALPAATGPDLSVTLIARTPEQPKADPKPYPAEGEEVTYTATVKNVGDAPAGSFSTEWRAEERGGAKIDVTKALGPGEETTVTLKRSFHLTKDDHRMQPLGLLITPSGKDADPTNNYLEIDQNARPITVRAKPGTENAIQAELRTWNDSISPMSRYSFAPDGSKERVRVQRFQFDSPTVDPLVDAVVGFQADAPEAFLGDIGNNLGLPNLGYGSEYGVDINPGIGGGGDTRYDGTLNSRLPLDYSPSFNLTVDTSALEANGLLSMTHVGTLNAFLNQRNFAGNDPYSKVPKTVLLKATDLAGHPVANTSISFYPLDNQGKMAATPNFSVKTSADGTTLLPSKGAFGAFTNADGTVSPALIAQIDANGVATRDVLKAWQAMDTYYRGNVAVAFMNLRFDTPSAPLDYSVNLAKDRFVADSLSTPADKLAPLVDGDPNTEVTLGSSEKDWIEIDLGRDRSIGEIALVLKDKQTPFWPSFEIHAYSTGQRPEEGAVWTQEPKWAWTAANRSTHDQGHLVVAYRGQVQRVRYIRILAKSKGEARLSEVRVVPIKISQ